MKIAILLQVEIIFEETSSTIHNNSTELGRQNDLIFSFVIAAISTILKVSILHF